MDKNISSFIYAFIQGKNEEAYIHTERDTEMEEEI